MKQTSSVLLVLVYQFYLGKCGTLLPSETTEMSWMLFNDGNGVADLLKVHETEEDMPNDVTFQLYTRSQPNSYTTLEPTEEADVGDFNSQRETKFIIHGWRSNGSNLDHIRKAYLEAGDYNVIVVDWSTLAAGWYLTATLNMNLVGEYLATLIDILVMYHDLRPEDVHIVGHSLGAQMAGIAGNRTKSGKPGRITGLDPAALLFCYKDPGNRLDFTDGQFVDVIHTCGGLMGLKAPIGHADFYPNGGTAVQPGCDLHPEDDGLSKAPPDISCSHSRAHKYFAESITTTSGFVSYECPSWDDYKDGKCFKNSRTLMGEFTNIRGSYYLQTAESSPYALGSTSALVDSALEKYIKDLSNSVLC